MSERLMVDKIVDVVLKKIYKTYGAQVVIFIDEIPDFDGFVTRLKTLMSPWTSYNLFFMSDSKMGQLKMLRNCGLLINKVYCEKNLVPYQQILEKNGMLILSSLNVFESKNILDFQIATLKTRLIYDFLKTGKKVQFFSEDLRINQASVGGFIQRQLAQLEELELFGLIMLNQPAEIIEGFCDVQRIKRIQNKTIIITEGAVISPLAREYLIKNKIAFFRK